MLPKTGNTMLPKTGNTILKRDPREKRRPVVMHGLEEQN
jgi:hypothetical protein